MTFLEGPLFDPTYLKTYFGVSFGQNRSKTGVKVGQKVGPGKKDPPQLGPLVFLVGSVLST